MGEAATSIPPLVVLLHGILRSSRCMEKIALQLEDEGFETLNLDYPSIKHDLHKLADSVAERINETVRGNQTVHLVGFSMGGLLIRALLHNYDITNLGRVVMIGTPNHGSEVADFVHRFWLYEALYGPAGQQLITDQAQLEWWSEEIDYELGIIAGDVSLLGRGWWLIQGDNDGLVSVESTRLEGMRDHITVPGLHGFLPGNPQVIRQTVTFLKEGRFRP